MSKYACSDTECGMAVADLKCGICNVALELVLIEKIELKEEENKIWFVRN